MIHFCPIWHLETDALDQRLSICPTFGGKEDHDVPLYQGFFNQILSLAIDICTLISEIFESLMF